MKAISGERPASADLPVPRLVKGEDDVPPVSRDELASAYVPADASQQELKSLASKLTKQRSAVRYLKQEMVSGISKMLSDEETRRNDRRKSLQQMKKMDRSRDLFFELRCAHRRSRPPRDLMPIQSDRDLQEPPQHQSSASR